MSRIVFELTILVPRMVRLRSRGLGDLHVTKHRHVPEFFFFGATDPIWASMKLSVSLRFYRS
jgi:hypothetical protein